MDKTKIEWCDSTWNPVTGCLHNCAYCYARKQVKRFEGYDGTGGKKITAFNPAIADVPLPLFITRKNGKTVQAPYPFGFKPTFHYYHLDEPQHWKKPRTIFVCSMADLFGNWVLDKWIEEVFKACEKAPQHRYLFLTKNPERYKKLADKGKLPQKDNLWYGSTVTSKEMKAFCSLNYNTFVSIEPLLEPVNLCDASCVDPNWVIIGAETGNRKNKVVPQKEWIDDITAYCDLCKIPVFMKDSLIPIVGEENMRREFPWEKGATK